MTEEVQEKLFNRFSFYRPELPMTQSLMCFGIECGDGWFGILWELSLKIESILEKHLSEVDNAKLLLADDTVFNVSQVKEKFGTLRFYFDSSVDEEVYTEIRDAVREAEDKSAITCEVCGRPGELTSGGWKSVVCNECKNK